MKNSLMLAAAILLLGIAAPAHAQPRTQAIINAPADVQAGRPILLDASLSRVVGSDPQFQWFVEGIREPISRTVDAIYTPERPGVVRFRLIVRSMVDGTPQESEVTQEVTVYRRKVVLIADAKVPSEKVDAQVRAASGAELFVKLIRAPVASSSTESFTQFLSEQIPAFLGSDTVILWTDGVSGLPSLLQAFQRARSVDQIGSQSLVLVSPHNLSFLAQTARAPFAILQPQYIVLIHPEALSALLQAGDVPAFLASAKVRDLDVAMVDKSTPTVRPWLPLSLLSQYMLARGIASQTILLLLMLPVIATILSFLKQAVGMTTFGLFVPSILALSFLALGWWVGLLFFLFIIIIGSLSRLFTGRLHILYVPKVAIIITIVSLSLLVLLAIATAYGVVLSRDAVFILLIMSTLAESFLTAKAEHGWTGASSGIIQTIIAALLCVLMVQWPSFQMLVLAYPEVILFTVAVNVLVGRYTGLRLSEYIRFRELLKHVGTEE